MVQGSVLTWLDGHAGAVTAIATVVLVAITAFYAVATFLLVREQRRQSRAPVLETDWADPDAPGADLALHNVGTGPAVEVTLDQGPGDPTPGLLVEIEDLGWGITLPPSGTRTRAIRPIGGAQMFPNGELPVTISYFDDRRERLYLLSLLLTFEAGAIGSYGGTGAKYTTRSLKKMARKSLPRRRRLQFAWQHRSTNLPSLFAESDVRAAVGAGLLDQHDDLRQWARQLDANRGHI